MNKEDYNWNIPFIPPTERKQPEKISFSPNLLKQTKERLSIAFSGVKEASKEAVTIARMNLKKVINTNRRNIGLALASVSFMANVNMNQVQASEIASNNIPQVKTEQLNNVPVLEALKILNAKGTNFKEVVGKRVHKNIVGMGNGVNPVQGKYGNVKDTNTKTLLKTDQELRISAEIDRIEKEVRDIRLKNPKLTVKEAILKQALNDAVNGSYTSAEKAIEKQINQTSKNQTQEFTQSKLVDDDAGGVVAGVVAGVVGSLLINKRKRRNNLESKNGGDNRDSNTPESEEQEYLDTESQKLSNVSPGQTSQTISVISTPTINNKQPENNNNVTSTKKTVEKTPQDASESMPPTPPTNSDNYVNTNVNVDVDLNSKPKRHEEKQLDKKHMEMYKCLENLLEAAKEDPEYHSLNRKYNRKDENLSAIILSNIKKYYNSQKNIRELSNALEEFMPVNHKKDINTLNPDDHKDIKLFNDALLMLQRNLKYRINASKKFEI